MAYNHHARMDSTKLINQVLDNIGLKHIYTAIGPEEIFERFKTSALYEFSTLYPRLETMILDQTMRVRQVPSERIKSIEYKIPAFIYDFGQVEIVGIARLSPLQPSGYSDMFVPQGMIADPASVMTAIADVQIAAATAASMGRAPTFRFDVPDRLHIYNGWSAGRYEVDILLSHEPNLTTVPPTAIPSLRRLTELDLKEFIYQNLKRIENISTPGGDINLRLDDLQNASSEKQQLLDEWAQDSDLDTAAISWY